MASDVEFASITAKGSRKRQEESTHCFRVLDKRVGILSAVVFSTRPV